jgi:peptide deformylase
MEIVPIHYKVSKPVKNYNEIKTEANELIKLVASSNFKGLYNKAFAIAHAQVSEKPYAFFVVSKDVVDQGMFESQVIINPKILVKLDNVEVAKGIVLNNLVIYEEPCMSFPFRKPKGVTRYNDIKVSYQINSWCGLKTITKEVSGITSQILQHEFDHTEARNIYFTSENPIKWWELLGTPKSKGGTSLDDPDKLGLTKSSDKSIDG